MKRIILAAAALVVSPLAARATDIAGDGSTNASLPISGSYTNGTFEKAGDRDWYRVYLKAGKNYAFSAYGGRGESADDNGGISFDLRGVDGRVVTRTAWSGSETDGFGYRPTVTGTYFLEAVDLSGGTSGYPVGYQVRATTDCPDGPGTPCLLQIGTASQWLMTWPGDNDWMKVSLTAGKRYTATLTVAPLTRLQVLDPDRRVIGSAEGNYPDPAHVAFKALRTATYFVRVEAIEGEAPYTIKVTSP